MTTRPVTFKQHDVSRALKGAAAAGLEVGRIEIDPSGKIVIIFKGDKGAPAESTSEWDSVLQ
jgi:hypothetical protein